MAREGEKALVIADGELKPLIRRALAGSFSSDLIKKGSWIRVSSLASLCPREEVLRSIGDVNKEDPYDGDTGIILEHGNALHWDLQNRILPAAGVLYGQWRCACCGKVCGGWDPSAIPRKSIESSQILRPERCPGCDAELTSDNCVYQEQHFKNWEYRLQGHPDGFLKIAGLEGMGILEIKSINPKAAWEVRDCPKLDHVVQTQCYMWLTRLTWAKLLYWDKAGYGAGALIEHTLDYDEELVESIKEEVTAIRVGIEDGILPERTCEVRTCSRASKCSVTNACFERD